MLISGKTQFPSPRKVNAKKLKETVELNNSVIHNVITNSITEINNLLYGGAYMVAEKLGKMKESKRIEKQNKPSACGRIQTDIAEWRKDVSRLNKWRKGKFEFEKKDLD